MPENNEYIEHHGIKGQKWYVRRYQNEDGSLTALGRRRLGFGTKSPAQKKKELLNNPRKLVKNTGKVSTKDLQAAVEKAQLAEKLKEVQREGKAKAKEAKALALQKKLELKAMTKERKAKAAAAASQIKEKKQQLKMQKMEKKQQKEMKKLEQEIKKEEYETRKSADKWEKRAKKFKAIVDTSTTLKTLTDDMGLTDKNSGKTIFGAFMSGLGFKVPGDKEDKKKDKDKDNKQNTAPVVNITNDNSAFAELAKVLANNNNNNNNVTDAKGKKSTRWIVKNVKKGTDDTAKQPQTTINNNFNNIDFGSLGDFLKDTVSSKTHPEAIKKATEAVDTMKKTVSEMSMTDVKKEKSSGSSGLSTFKLADMGAALKFVTLKNGVVQPMFGSAAYDVTGDDASYNFGDFKFRAGGDGRLIPKTKSGAYDKRYKEGQWSDDLDDALIHGVLSFDDMLTCMRDDYIEHHGIKNQKWGVRRYQNPDGSLTELGKRHRAAAEEALTEQVRKSGANAGGMWYQYVSARRRNKIAKSALRRRKLRDAVIHPFKTMKGQDTEKAKEIRRERDNAAAVRDISINAYKKYLEEGQLANKTLKELRKLKKKDKAVS